MVQFHETGYGRKFFEVQLPKLINNLGRIADAMEKKEEGSKEESNFPYLKSGVASDELIKSTIEQSKDNIYDTPIADVFQEKFTNDPDYSESNLLLHYQKANEVERLAMDSVLIDLCGYSLKSLIEKAYE